MDLCKIIQDIQLLKKNNEILIKSEENINFINNIINKIKNTTLQTAARKRKKHFPLAIYDDYEIEYINTNNNTINIKYKTNPEEIILLNKNKLPTSYSFLNLKGSDHIKIILEKLDMQINMYNLWKEIYEEIKIKKNNFDYRDNYNINKLELCTDDIIYNCTNDYKDPSGRIMYDEAYAISILPSHSVVYNVNKYHIATYYVIAFGKSKGKLRLNLFFDYEHKFKTWIDRSDLKDKIEKFNDDTSKNVDLKNLFTIFEKMETITPEIYLKGDDENQWNHTYCDKIDEDFKTEKCDNIFMNKELTEKINKDIKLGNK